MTKEEKTEFWQLWREVQMKHRNVADKDTAAWLMFRAMNEREAVPVPIVNAAREQKLGAIVDEAVRAAKGGKP